MSNITSSQIKNLIYSFRGYRVMLDSDLAQIYGVNTKVLNQAVSRNDERFPLDFCSRSKFGGFCVIVRPYKIFSVGHLFYLLDTTFHEYSRYNFKINLNF